MKCAPFWQAALAAALVVGLCARARAQGAATGTALPVTLDYDVPSTCPDAREFRSSVTKRLGRDPFVEEAPNRVLVLVSLTDEVISGELVWHDAAGNSTGKQSFPSRTKRCAEVIAAMGFALAVQIQLLETAEDAAPKPSSQAAPVPDSTPPKVGLAPAPPHLEREAPPVVAHPPKTHTAAPAFSLGGGGAVDLGMSSQPMPSGRLFVGARWARAAVELAVQASAPVTTRRADGAGVSQWYLLASTAGCGVIEPWSACAVLKAGSVRAAGHGVDTPNTAGAALVQSGLRLALSQRVTESTFLAVRAEGLVNLTRWSVALDHFPVWGAPRLALDSGLDFGVRFR